MWLICYSPYSHQIRNPLNTEGTFDHALTIPSTSTKWRDSFRENSTHPSRVQTFSYSVAAMAAHGGSFPCKNTLCFFFFDFVYILQCQAHVSPEDVQGDSSPENVQMVQVAEVESFITLLFVRGACNKNIKMFACGVCGMAFFSNTTTRSG